ncbi:cell division ATP-binding protein FtsE [Patescibacteria group bacterium]|nr:cell division ATP-binding protein FtsE [Patescibacteria group bacterium]MCL5797817.1 cell division ATP-binding protein FtsE [Patescibacteria group bacterium]
MILFDSVSKKYSRSTTALDDINLKVEDGEYVFLVGPSGAGKTTILRLLIRDLLPNHGTILLDDWEINKLPVRKLPYLRRKVGFVFQDFKLLSDRTVAENIAVSLEILGKSRSDIDRRIDEVLKIVHLDSKENHFIGQLSYGEQQRVAIGRAIAGEAKILLADEPTGNLDPKTSWEILKIISDINKSGTTVVMATHNVDIVNSLKKRVVVLSSGKIVRDEHKGKYS